jgi:hypothetical protein
MAFSARHGHTSFLAACAYHTTVVLLLLTVNTGLVSTQSHRTNALANCFFSRVSLSHHSLFRPGNYSGPSGSSRPNTHLPSPASVSPIHLSFPACLLTGPCRVAKRGRRCSSRYVSLHGAVPYSSPPKGVQSAWIVGSESLHLLYYRRRQFLRKAACRSRLSSNSFVLLSSYRAYTQCLAPPVHLPLKRLL